MDELQLLLGIPQGVQQGTDTLQPRGVGLPLKGIDIGNGLLTGHGPPPSHARRTATWRRSSFTMGIDTIATSTAVMTPTASRSARFPST